MVEKAQEAGRNEGWHPPGGSKFVCPLSHQTMSSRIGTGALGEFTITARIARVQDSLPIGNFQNGLFELSRL